LIDLYNISVGNDGDDLVLYCGICSRTASKLPTGQLLPDLIEEAEGHLRLLHDEVTHDDA
jgi:hypothetical protein